MVKNTVKLTALNDNDGASLSVQDYTVRSDISIGNRHEIFEQVLILISNRAGAFVMRWNVVHIYDMIKHGSARVGFEIRAESFMEITTHAQSLISIVNWIIINEITADNRHKK